MTSKQIEVTKLGKAVGEEDGFTCTVQYTLGVNVLTVTGAFKQADVIIKMEMYVVRFGWVCLKNRLWS